MVFIATLVRFSGQITDNLKTFLLPWYLIARLFTSQAKVDIGATNIDKTVLCNTSGEGALASLRMGHLRTERSGSRQSAGRSWHQCQGLSQ